MSHYQWRSRQELHVCHDCIYFAANGAPDFEGYAESGHRERYLKAAKQYGDEPMSINDESHYSKNPCDFCDESLGGDRYVASVMQLFTDGGE